MAMGSDAQYFYSGHAKGCILISQKMNRYLRRLKEQDSLTRWPLLNAIPGNEQIIGHHNKNSQQQNQHDVESVIFGQHDDFAAWAKQHVDQFAQANNDHHILAAS